MNARVYSASIRSFGNLQDLEFKIKTLKLENLFHFVLFSSSYDNYSVELKLHWQRSLQIIGKETRVDSLFRKCP